MIAWVWAAAAAHALLFDVISRRIVHPGRSTAACAAFSTAVVLGTALPIFVCARSDCTRGTLTISRAMAPWPWCVAFGLMLAATGLASRFAIRDMGCPRTGVAAMVALLCVGAAPDRGGTWTQAHMAAVALVSVCVCVLAVNADVDRGRVAHIRAHVVAGAAWAAFSISCVYRSGQTDFVRTMGMAAEMASFIHVGACLA